MDSETILSSVRERCRGGSTGFDCFREGNAQRLQLWGTLPPDWAHNLSLQLFAPGLEIISADAESVGGSRWAASFLLRAADPRAQTARCDFLQMTRRRPRGVPCFPEPAIEIAVDFESGSPGIVVARVTGKDSTGLLALVLARFSAFSLQVARFSLRTLDGEVEDWFWLEPGASEITGT